MLRTVFKANCKEMMDLAQTPFSALAESLEMRLTGRPVPRSIVATCFASLDGDLGQEVGVLGDPEELFADPRRHRGRTIGELTARDFEMCRIGSDIHSWINSIGVDRMIDRRGRCLHNDSFDNRMVSEATSRGSFRRLGGWPVQDC